jgi:gas vesicle protein
MTENPSTRFVSIRLSPDEFKDVYQHLQESTCRSLTEYAKKLLTNKPVIVKVRDQSREDVLQQLTLIKTRLDSLLDKAEPGEQEALQREIAEIKSAIRQIAEKCSQS